MDIHAFALKYGIRGMGLAIERVLELVPESAENEKNFKLGQLLGEMVADLETSLEKVVYKR